MAAPTIRLATPLDAAAMARVHVLSWQETYRGLMSDELLEDPQLNSRRERFWRISLTDEQFIHHQIALAENCGEVVGIAQSSPPTDVDATWSRQLNVLYMLADAQGSGAGVALLEAVLYPTESAGLWVANPNPRAQAFYRKNGFEPDGSSKDGYGINEIRMVRFPPLIEEY